jgi:hypothetical protein
LEVRPDSTRVGLAHARRARSRACGLPLPHGMLLGLLSLASLGTTRDEQRAAMLFEGLMSGLGSPIASGMLPRALDTTCGLHLEIALREAQPGLLPLVEAYASVPTREEQEQTRAVTAGMRHLGRALRAFANMCHRCHLLAGGRLGRLAARVSALEARNISAASTGSTGGPSGLPRILLDGTDIGEALARAGSALRDERYYQAGLGIALALTLAADAEDEEPFGDDTYTTFDARGRVRSESELHSHLHERHARRISSLYAEEKRLQRASRPPLLGSASSTEAGVQDNEVGHLCCCCWAEGIRGEIAVGAHGIAHPF